MSPFHERGVSTVEGDATWRKAWMLRGHLVSAFGDLSTVAPPGSKR